MRGQGKIPARAPIFAIVAAACYLIISHSVPEGLSEYLPEVSLRLNRRNPESVLKISEQLIIEEKERRAEVEQARQETSQEARKPLDPTLRQRIVGALQVAPLNAHAYQLLGQLSELEDKPRTAKRLMTIASTLSRHEVRALAFLMRERLSENDSRAAIGYADILMRSSMSAGSDIAPILAQLSEIPAAREELVKRLGENPPWRAQVLRAFASLRIHDPRAPYELFSALQASPHPISEKELAGYIRYLFKLGAYQFAYSAWARFLPESDIHYLAHVFNGSFERNPSGMPFDWGFGTGREAKVGIFARPDNSAQSALWVSFGRSRAQFPAISEILVLKPGAYRFKGIYQGELRARRGLQWSVTCVSGLRAGESDMLVGQIPTWRVFSFDILIPADRCPAQHLQLSHMARSPSEQLASGYMWFDDIEIIRAEDAPPLDQAPPPQ